MAPLGSPEEVGTGFVFPELGLGPGGLRAQCANTAESRRCRLNMFPSLLPFWEHFWDEMGVRGVRRKEVEGMWCWDNSQDKSKLPQVVPAEV